MLEKFKRFLILNGYSEFTPSGHPSTVYDYTKRIEGICKRERISIHHLAENISFYVERYDTNGSEEDFGRRSHNAFISALKSFQEFCTIEFTTVQRNYPIGSVDLNRNHSTDVLV